MAETQPGGYYIGSDGQPHDAHGNPVRPQEAPAPELTFEQRVAAEAERRAQAAKSQADFDNAVAAALEKRLAELGLAQPAGGPEADNKQPDDSQPPDGGKQPASGLTETAAHTADLVAESEKRAKDKK